MKPVKPVRSRLTALAPAILAALALLPSGACLWPPSGKPPPDPDLAHGVERVVNDIVHQLGLFDTSRILVIDPLLDGRTGQQTGASEGVQRELASSLVATIKSLKVVAFNGEGASQARWLVTGTLTVLPEPNRYRL